jgi:hypothetical protein
MPADWRVTTKQCARCGATFGPRPEERPKDWTTRRFCSQTCRLQWLHEQQTQQRRQRRHDR